jgi:hypothetical protein
MVSLAAGSRGFDSAEPQRLVISCGRISKCAKTLRARVIQSTAEVELAQLRNRICKRESYQLEVVQYDCASTGSGKSLNRFTMGHRTGCS